MTTILPRFRGDGVPRRALTRHGFDEGDGGQDPARQDWVPAYAEAGSGAAPLGFRREMLTKAVFILRRWPYPGRSATMAPWPRPS
jgi:hypothetical protein